MSERVYVGHEDVVLRWSNGIWKALDATAFHVCIASFVEMSFLRDPWSGSPPEPYGSGNRTARIYVNPLPRPGWLQDSIRAGTQDNVHWPCSFHSIGIDVAFIASL